MNQSAWFDVWAPPGAWWSAWAKPVLFASLGRIPPWSGDLPNIGDLDTHWAPRSSEDALLILDLPEDEAVWHGLALAQRGYRPIPLYNTTHGRTAVIPVERLIAAIEAATPILENIRLSATSPPAFLLDSRRTVRLRNKPTPGMYDNRWLVFPQDFPSANYLLAHRVSQVILVQRSAINPADDLCHILRRWQEHGIGIFAKDLDDGERPRAITVRRPSRFRAAWYRALAMSGLRRNSAGGFGSIVPQPSESSGGGFG